MTADACALKMYMETQIDLGVKMGRVIFVSRHQGAWDWFRAREADAVLLEHLDVASVQTGDRIVGNLPMNLAAEICQRGARFEALIVPRSAGDRHQELSAEDLDRAGAYLQAYQVEAVD